MFTLNERQIPIQVSILTMAVIKETFITIEVLLYYGTKIMMKFFLVDTCRLEIAKKKPL